MRNAVDPDYVLHRETTVNCALPEVCDFFSKAQNLEALTPPWL
jgi:ligand-binding SRPBCC domain-containing protein